MLPIRVLQPSHSPVRGHRGRLRLGGRAPADRFSPLLVSRLPVSSFKRVITHPRLAIPLLWRLLTSQGISSLGSPQVRTRCFPTRPPHFPPTADPPVAEPPRLDLSTSLCCASSSRHVGLICGSCSSARQFPLAFLPLIGYPFRVGFEWWLFHVFTCGPPTGDFPPATL